MRQSDKRLKAISLQTVQYPITVAEASRTEDISIEELKQLGQFKDIEEEQAMALIKWIKQYTEIVYSAITKETGPTANIVSMEDLQTKNKAA